jgi:signal transduction histidine kinase/CheY-like chemotaxis protein
MLMYTVVVSTSAVWKLPFGLFLICATLIANRRRLLKPSTAAWLIPLAITIVGTMTASRPLDEGNGNYLLFMVACAIISLSYLNIRSLLIYICIANTLALIMTVAPGLGFLTQHSSIWTPSRLITYDTICVMLVWTCSFFKDKSASAENSSRTFKAIMETTPSYMAIINDNAEVEYISASLANWLGISNMTYAKNSALIDLLPTGDMKMMFQEIMEQGGYIERNFEETSGDERHWFVLRSSMLGKGGISRFFDWVDITPIMKAKNEAESATRAKSDFLANVSHEIRTPMNAIIGMTELMLADPLSSEQEERAAAIRTAAKALLDIVNDILDFSKIEARKMEVISKPFDFSSFLNDIVNMINIKANAAGLAFTVRVAHDMPTVVCLDDIRLRQCLLNLLNNAVKFTNSGCVSLSARSSVMAGGRLKLSFSVSDTGLGIRRDHIGKLFNEFQQLDTHKNRNLSGTGLGLAITRRLVELMDGEITVESVYGEGSIFSFFVTCERLDSKNLARVSNPDVRVLCYEPNGYHADALDKTLRDLGVPRDVAGDTDDALKLLGGGGYTHVLFDASGKEFLNASAPGTRFIMLRNVLDPKNPDFIDVLTRPLLPTTLANLLNGLDKTSPRVVGDAPVGDLQTRNALVLVVDDNPVNLAVAEGLLSRCGVSVDVAHGGREAVARASSAEYDIIFMDHMMPDMDGLDATRAIRAMGGRHQDSVIVTLTANALPDAREEFSRAGMNGFLAKPILVSELHDILVRYLPKEKIARAGQLML